MYHRPKSIAADTWYNYVSPPKTPSNLIRDKERAERELAAEVKRGDVKIKSSELKKIAPLSLMLVFIMFIGGILAPMRDTLMIKVAVCGGAETTVMLKLTVIPFASILFTAIFIKLTKKYNTTQVLTLVVTFFITFFLLFGLILFPLHRYLQMSEATIKHWQGIFPHAYWFVVCVGNWLFSLFHIISSLWTFITLPLIFWHIANTYTTKEEAKKYFGIFTLISPLGGFAAGQFLHYLGIKYHSASNYGQCMMYQLIAASSAGIFLILTCSSLFKRVIKDNAPMAAQMKNKEKIGVWNSVKYMATNKKAACVAIFAASYYMVINPIEAVWKEQMKIAGYNAVEFNAINGLALSYSNLLMIALSLVMTVSLSKCKWQVTAIITPILMSIFGLGFMIISEWVNIRGTNSKTLISWTVIIGTITVCVAKGCNKSVFGATKNLAYRILAPEDRLKARFAIEACGSRIGEVIGNAIPAILTNVIFSGASVISRQVLPYITVFIIAGLIICFLAISKIEKYTEKW